MDYTYTHTLNLCHKGDSKIKKVDLCIKVVARKKKKSI